MFETNGSQSQARIGVFLARRDGAYMTAFNAAPIVDVTETRVVPGNVVSMVQFRRVRPNPAGSDGPRAA